MADTIVPKYRLSERSYNYYADDTHSGGRILDNKFDIVPTGKNGLRPFTFCTGMLIESKRESQFFSGFNEIRGRFAQYLRMSDLPIIHMRQMWGKNPSDGPQKNPFYYVDFNTRFLWAREILEYLCDEGREGFGFSGGSLDLSVIQSTSYQFHRSETMKNEHEILKTKFRHHIKEFYDIILNPLPFGIGSLMVDLDSYLNKKGGRATFIYDSPEGSKGFDLLESYDIARNAGYLSNIEKVVPSTTRRHVGLQCADVIAYIQQREKHAIEFNTHDDGIFRLMNGLAIPIFMEDNPRRQNHLKKDLISVATMLHYELGIYSLKKLDPSWVEQNMYSPAEIMRRFRTGTRFGDLQTGSNLVKDEVHAAWAHTK